MAHAFLPSGNNAWTASCDTTEDAKWFNYSLRHLPVTILITGIPRCNYISLTGQFGEYRHGKSCITYIEAISQFDCAIIRPATDASQNNSASTRADLSALLTLQVHWLAEKPDGNGICCPVAIFPV